MDFGNEFRTKILDKLGCTITSGIYVLLLFSFLAFAMIGISLIVQLFGGPRFQIPRKIMENLFVLELDSFKSYQLEELSENPVQPIDGGATVHFIKDLSRYTISVNSHDSDLSIQKIELSEFLQNQEFECNTYYETYGEENDEQYFEIGCNNLSYYFYTNDGRSIQFYSTAGQEELNKFIQGYLAIESN